MFSFKTRQLTGVKYGCGFELCARRYRNKAHYGWQSSRVFASKPSEQHSWISLQMRLSQEGPLCRSATTGLCVELKHEVKSAGLLSRSWQRRKNKQRADRSLFSSPLALAASRIPSFSVQWRLTDTWIDTETLIWWKVFFTTTAQHERDVNVNLKFNYISLMSFVEDAGMVGTKEYLFVIFE